MLVMQKEDAPLYKVMACLLDVKKRSGRTEASFGPLRDTVRNPAFNLRWCLPREISESLQSQRHGDVVSENGSWLRTTKQTTYCSSCVLLQVELLQRYNISLSDSTLKQLEEAPVAWAALQKKIIIRYTTVPFVSLMCCGCALSER